MKHFPLILAALAFSVPSLYAKVYNITLTNADTYTQCQIKYKGSSTKFVGKNKKGEVKTLVVPSSQILTMKEVAEEKPAPAAEAPKPAPAAPEAVPAAEGPKAEGDTPAASEEKKEEGAAAEEQPAPAPAEGEQQAQDDGQAQNASLRLREKLTGVDNAYAELRAPSKALSRRVSVTRERIVNSLDKLDKQALTVAELQGQFNQAGHGEFTFDIVSTEQRSQYQRDGEAAYQAMVIDMNEKQGARKVGGLDKFEIMRSRYQGIPEYKQAYEKYIRTLKALDKKWTKMLATEEKRRKSAQAAKKAAMADDDEKELEALRASFEREGEDIAAVWYNPRPRNIAMLKSACNKVAGALRHNESTKLDDAVGTIPSLLNQFWEAMDNARRHMVAGELDQAEDVLKKDGSYDVLRRMRADIFPSDYREPIMEQRKKLEDEIRDRKRDSRNIKTKLEHEASALERAAGSAEAQMNALLEEIQRERDLDAGENSVAMEASMSEPEEGEAGGEAPAEAEAPAEGQN